MWKWVEQMAVSGYRTLYIYNPGDANTIVLVKVLTALQESLRVKGSFTEKEKNAYCWIERFPVEKKTWKRKTGGTDRGSMLVINDVSTWKKSQFIFVMDLSFQKCNDSLTSIILTNLLPYRDLQGILTIVTRNLCDKLIVWISWLTIMSLQINQTMERYNRNIITKCILMMFIEFRKLLELDLL